MEIVWFIVLIIVYWLMYVKLPERMNITHDFEEKVFNKTDVKRYIEENFKDVKYDFVTNTVYVFDNSVMVSPKFIEMLSRWRVFIQPNLF